MQNLSSHDIFVWSFTAQDREVKISATDSKGGLFPSVNKPESLKFISVGPGKKKKKIVSEEPCFLILKLPKWTFGKFLFQHKAKRLYLYNQFHGQTKVVSSCVVPNDTKLGTLSDARRVVITHPKQGHMYRVSWRFESRQSHRVIPGLSHMHRVSWWCFESRQPQRVIPGLSHMYRVSWWRFESRQPQRVIPGLSHMYRVSWWCFESRQPHRVIPGLSHMHRTDAHFSPFSLYITGA